MSKIPNGEWMGFCGYRRFWRNEKKLSNVFKDNVLKDIPNLWEDIFSQNNITSNFNLDKKQAIINLIENILKFKKNDTIERIYEKRI